MTNTNTQLDMETIKATLEENGYLFTNKVNESIYLFPNGEMIDGQFDCGMRAEDHRMIECLIEGLDRYDGGKFWDAVHERLQVVRMVPEYKYALIKVRQQLSDIQIKILKRARFQVEEY